MSSESIQLAPIGVVRSPFKTRFGTPKQPSAVPSARATLQLYPQSDLNGCLEGLEEFSHLWVIFLFHENTNTRVRGKVHPPRLEGRKMGLFATRTPHRPNPVGLSLVKIEKVDEWSIEVSGVDLLDGTPILDIKPYVSEADLALNAKSGWVEQNAWRKLEVQFTPEAEEQLGELVREEELVGVRQLILETLAQDPRPQVYREDVELKYRETHALYLSNLDVHFEVKDQLAVVLHIRLRQSS